MQRPQPIRWLRERPRRADLLLAVVLTTVSLVLHFAVDPELAADDADGFIRAPSWWTPPLVVLSALPVYWRRSRPALATTIVVTAQVLASFIGIVAGSFLGVIVALYSLAAHGNDPLRTRVAIGSFVSIALLFVAGVLSGVLGIGNLISSTVILVTAYVLGDNLRRRRQHVDALAERAERAEREQQLLAQQQVAAERTRIARELHDVVAHSVSVMVIQAAAARRSLRTNPELAEDTLSSIENTGRQTMTELRGILGVLRRHDDSDPDVRRDGQRADPVLAPQPTLDDLHDLVATDADLPITLQFDDRVRANGHGDRRIPRGIAMTAYRVVQEGLTNVRRHAGPVSSVDVGVALDGDRLRIRVADDGRGAAADSSEPGFGLIGMRERVAAVGGTVAAVPRTGGGWVVDAELPLSPRAADTRRHDPSTRELDTRPPSLDTRPPSLDTRPPSLDTRPPSLGGAEIADAKAEPR